MAVITENGVIVDTIQEAIVDNTATYSAITGDVDVAPSSAAGEAIAITSEMDVRNQQNIADAFTQNTVVSATGENLDNIAQIKNQERRVNQKSVVYIKAEGTDTTIIPKGTVFICSVNQEEFLSDFEAEIVSGEAFVSASSVNNGVSCQANSIQLQAPITGITSVDNQSAAEIGFDIESDSLLRSRLQLIGSPYTNNVKEGLFLALSEVQNVAKVNILDNNTDSPIDGVPARNFSAVVLGGNQAEVAKTIFRYTGVGNPSFGDIKQLVTSDITGDIYPINFNLPEELLTVVVATLTVNSEFDTDAGFDIVKNNIVDYFESLDIGEDLLLQKVEGVCLIRGVDSAAITLNGSGVSLFSTFKQLFVTNDANVTVT